VSRLQLRARTAKWVLLGASCVVALALIEGSLRVLVRPSELSAGRLFGFELPPIRVIPDRDFEPDTGRDEAYRGLVVDGQRITVGDLWGFHREDARLGYVTREGMTSRNGWWQSNGLGARERAETLRAIPDGKTRVLVFGDSYAQGSRLPQEQTWPEVVEARWPALDLVNLAVDGYGMGQAYLRYQGLRDALDHDVVLLMFVPIRDLWRDVNVLRTLGEDWDLYLLMPRYTLDGSALRLVPPPYADPTEVFRANRRGLSPELERHLRRYDRFYFEGEHRPVATATGRLVLPRLLAEVGYLLRRRSLRDGGLDRESEALAVTHAIFVAMDADVRRSGARFVVVLLPSERDLERLRGSAGYRREWRALVEWLGEQQMDCIDLSGPLLDRPTEELDTGYDGTHFGPKVNARIAGVVGQALAL
jgi:hypothetical protein